MPNLSIVGNIYARTGQSNQLNAEFVKPAPITQSKASCIEYGLHQDNANPALICKRQTAPLHNSRQPK